MSAKHHLAEPAIDHGAIEMPLAGHFPGRKGLGKNNTGDGPSAFSRITKGFISRGSWPAKSLVLNMLAGSELANSFRRPRACAPESLARWGISSATYFLSSLTGLIRGDRCYPPINRWAIFGRPAGLEIRHWICVREHLAIRTKHPPLVRMDDGGRRAAFTPLELTTAYRSGFFRLCLLGR